MFTITKNLCGGGKLALGIAMLVTAAAAQVFPPDQKVFVVAQQLSGSYLVSITLDAEPGVAYPGLVSYAPSGSVVANEAINFAGTPLAGATITEDHGDLAGARS